jgi:hypothetical protein
MADAYTTRRAKADRRDNQSLRYEYGPVCLFLAGDLHIGSTGTDYGRIQGLFDLLATTPGGRLVCLGDVADNMVIGKLLRERMHTAFSMEEEWAAVDYALATLAPYLDVVVGGNHDAWTRMVAGFDRLRMALPDSCLYDPDEIKATVRVGSAEWRPWLRHQFKGRSIYNPLHAEMRAVRFDDPSRDILASGHTHPGVVIIDEPIHARRVLHVKVGAFKKLDSYARRLGFARPTLDDVAAVVLDEDGSRQAFASADAAARYMRALYPNA